MTMRLLSTIFNYKYTLVVLAVVCYATLAEDPAGVDELPKIPHIDKLIHAIMMGGIVGAAAFDRMRSGHQLTRRFMLAITLGVMAFGIVDEFLQGLLTANRASDVIDILADWVGAWVAFFTAPPAVKRVLRRKTGS